MDRETCRNPFSSEAFRGGRRWSAWRARGITVNSVEPGIVRTEIASWLDDPTLSKAAADWPLRRHADEPDLDPQPAHEPTGRNPGPRHRDIDAHEVTIRRREELRPTADAAWPHFPDYRTRTEREIPIFEPRKVTPNETERGEAKKR
jgi:NAD(P)-dependent dehydrogenase (short-subunit alcohol dehydrogenase family)